MRGILRGLVQLVRLTIAVLLIQEASSQANADVIFNVPEVLVRHAAVPRPVGSGTAAPRTETQLWAEGLHQKFEYFVEHSISTIDAKRMAMILKPSEIPETLPGCGNCTKRDMEYCETKVLADHCCCERHFWPEPFPWLPHTCYIGSARCMPLAQNCAQYARLRDCCCMRKLAEQWKDILSESSQVEIMNTVLIGLAAVLVAIYI